MPGIPPHSGGSRDSANRRRLSATSDEGHAAHAGQDVEDDLGAGALHGRNRPSPSGTDDGADPSATPQRPEYVSQSPTSRAAGR